MVSAISSAMSGAVDFAQMQKQLLKRADSDGDNLLSLDEFEAAKPADAPADGPSSSEIFNNLDADQDGYLTEQELADGAEKMGPPPGGPPPQALSEDSVKTLLELLAEELEKTATSVSSDGSDKAASSTEETDETESVSAAASAEDEEEKALALIQQFIDEYRSAQASYLSAQNLVASPGVTVSTVG